jgi:hypothetical protein
VIVLGRASLKDAIAGCQALGEELWAPELETASIQENLNYLFYQGTAKAETLFWIAAGSDGQNRAIDTGGNVSDVDSGLRLPVLCAQSAPYSNATFTDTSEKWQISVHSNNQDIVGSVSAFHYGKALGSRTWDLASATT